MSFTWKSDGIALLSLGGIFAAAYTVPIDSPRLQGALLEGLHLVQWYAREHMALCVVPALFIAGAIGVFISQGAIMRHLGQGARPATAYAVASVSGSLLAVCSCTVLPLFAGIYKRGAGLGPAIAFLYAGPAINVLAIILTARVLGWELGVARVVGAVGFSVVVGALMHLLYRREEAARAAEPPPVTGDEEVRSLPRTVVFFSVMTAILVAANWSPSAAAVGWWDAVHAAKWWITGLLGLIFAVILVRWYGMQWWRIAPLAAVVLVVALLWPELHELSFSIATIGLAWLTARSDGELGDWFDQSWAFARQIIPLLLIGVLVAGILLGRPGHEGLIPSGWITTAVGGEGLGATIIAAVAGAFMYFATLTEIPILQGLMGSGMGKGPALALLLAGPALSLPSMLVLRSIMGTQKTLVFTALVIAMATLTGWLFGQLA